MTAHTDADVQAVSELLLATYDSEYSSAGLTWRNFEDEARRYLDAVAPAIAARAKAEALRDAADAWDANDLSGFVHESNWLRARADKAESAP